MARGIENPKDSGHNTTGTVIAVDTFASSGAAVHPSGARERTKSWEKSPNGQVSLSVPVALQSCSHGRSSLGALRDLVA